MSTFKLGPATCDPGEGSKVQILLHFNFEVHFKDFIPNFVCVLTNKRYKTYRTGFSFCRLGHAPGVGFGGAGVKILAWGFAMAPHRLRVLVL